MLLSKGVPHRCGTLQPADRLRLQVSEGRGGILETLYNILYIGVVGVLKETRGCR
jgi:hypothetical protein